MRLRIAAGELLLLNVLPHVDAADKEADKEAARLRPLLAKASFPPASARMPTPCPPDYPLPTTPPPGH